MKITNGRWDIITTDFKSKICPILNKKTYEVIEVKVGEADITDREKTIKVENVKMFYDNLHIRDFVFFKEKQMKTNIIPMTEDECFAIEKDNRIFWFKNCG